MKKLLLYIIPILIISGLWIAYDYNLPENVQFRQMIELSESMNIPVDRTFLKENLPLNETKKFGDKDCYLSVLDTDIAFFIYSEGEMYLYDKRPTLNTRYVEYQLPCGVDKLTQYEHEYPEWESYWSNGKTWIFAKTGEE